MSAGRRKVGSEEKGGIFPQEYVAFEGEVGRKRSEEKRGREREGNRGRQRGRR